MSDLASEVEQLKTEQAALLRAVKISLSLVLLALTGTCIHAALSISTWAGIFKDMMPGSPLPLVTEFVVSQAGPLLVMTVLLCVGGFGMLAFSKRRSRLGWLQSRSSGCGCGRGGKMLAGSPRGARK